MNRRGLRRCQVETPPDLVDLLWSHALRRRNDKPFQSELDLGAGDGRFAAPFANYKQYVGYEIDPRKYADVILPRGARIKGQDALLANPRNFDLCIGNPPYIRHHDLTPRWHQGVLDKLGAEADIEIKQTANAFVLFLLQAMLRTSSTGLVVQLIPFEWVTRPSALEIRDYISAQRWNVSVYRFNATVFPTVLTTASLTVIDKSTRDGRWAFGEIVGKRKIRATKHPSGTKKQVLDYAPRSTSLYAQRGLSPGGQDIFVFTDEERKRLRLKKRRDVLPCVVSLRHFPAASVELTDRTFQKFFIDAGRQCWLLRSFTTRPSARVRAYIRSVGQSWKKYSTCTARTPWWRYKPHPVPTILIASGFIGRRPKVVTNTAGAVAVGAVYGVVSGHPKRASQQIVSRLATYDFNNRVVSHSNNLRKIEVRQLNSVLDKISRRVE